MRKLKKKYKRPQTMWDKARIDRDAILKKNYGLVRKKEIWKAETMLRKYRRFARRLAAIRDKSAEKVLIGKLVDLGLLGKGAGLDECLSLTVENILDRRLETIVFKKGFANTAKQSRQLITHGHVKIDGKKSVNPGRFLSIGEESGIVVDMTVPKKAGAS
jgi:small subunit ribosomal protein S4